MADDPLAIPDHLKHGGKPLSLTAPWEIAETMDTAGGTPDVINAAVSRLLGTPLRDYYGAEALAASVLPAGWEIAHWCDLGCWPQQCIVTAGGREVVGGGMSRAQALLQAALLAMEAA